ncbi:hypothetical protein BC332_25737 [Capsicum chinense]|nr:hypothetical protein BC332_25737 [Capsicum chinense]
MKRLSSNWPELVSELESYIPRLHYRRVCWEFPSGQWIQCKTDGASRGNPGKSGAAVVFRDAAGGESPLEIKRVMERDLRDFLKGLIPERPEFIITGGGGEDIIHVIMPSRKEDAFALMGLSITQLCPYHSEMPEEAWVKPLVGDGSVYRLISSFLSLTVFEDLGGIRIYTSSGVSGIPPTGDITRVLLDIALKNHFDSQFPKSFPGIVFHRFVNEVYIFIRKNEKVLFDDKAGYALLEELGLRE